MFEENFFEWRTTKGIRIGIQFSNKDKAKDWATTYSRISDAHKSMFKTAKLFEVVITRKERVIE